MSIKFRFAACLAFSAVTASAGSFTAACSTADLTSTLSGYIGCPLYSAAEPLTGVDIVFSGSSSAIVHLRTNGDMQDVIVDYSTTYTFGNSATPLFSNDTVITGTLSADESYRDFPVGGTNQADAGIDQATIGSYIGNGFVLIPVTRGGGQTIIQGIALGSNTSSYQSRATGSITYFTAAPEPGSLILLLTALAVLPATGSGSIRK